MLKTIYSILTLLFIGTLVLLTACQSSDAVEIAIATNPDALPVGVSASPQQYFVERIGGKHVAVTSMLTLGDDPVTYMPSAERVEAFGETAVFFYTGLPSENNWLKNSQSAATDTTFVDLRNEMDIMDNNPYIWLTPMMAQQQAQTIYDSLVTADPANKADYQTNFEELTADLSQLHVDMDEILSPIAGKVAVISNPAWAYFAKEYELEMHTITAIDGTLADDARLAELTAVVEENNLNFIFVQSNTDDLQAKEFAIQHVLRTIPLNPFHPNWINNMHSTALLIAVALEDTPIE